jgi:hypothetical protein
LSIYTGADSVSEVIAEVVTDTDDDKDMDAINNADAYAKYQNADTDTEIDIMDTEVCADADANSCCNIPPNDGQKEPFTLLDAVPDTGSDVDSNSYANNNADGPFPLAINIDYVEEI